MPTLDDLVREHAGLDGDDVEWLRLLRAEWQLLADLSFADLLMWVPTRAGDAWLVAAHVRPTTGPTVYHDDRVGDVMPRGRRPQLDAAYDERRICRERDPEWREDVPVREETIPVVRRGRVIAVLSRHTDLAAARTPSRLELTYLRCAGDLAQMVAEGSFPVVGAPSRLRAAPRVGDGLIRLDEEGTVTYASPNALSAYRRLGLAADLVGAHLGEASARLAPTSGPVDEALPVTLGGRAPRETEVVAGHTTVALRVLPLSPGGVRIGALVLARDVTELRRRERELVTKDATIREIHHRVKNNLQTVAALLRMQARRIDEPRGRAALEEAVGRVGAIALVHETLSGALDEHVDFDVIAEGLATAVTDMPLAGTAVAHRRTGAFGRLPAAVATPLALVLNELLQNAVEHGLGTRGGTVVVHAERDGRELRMRVRDDGVGLAPGWEARSGNTLGLQIVRTLVVSELAGTLSLRSPQEGGAEADVVVPLP